VQIYKTCFTMVF